MKDALEKLFGFAALVVIGLFILTHRCWRLGCVRYPWASYVPYLESIESAMTVVVLIFLGMYLVGEIR